MYHSKPKSRFVAVLLCVIMCIAYAMPLTIFAAPAINQGTDVILVIDDTRSMKTTDPNGLSSIAINKFVEKLPANSDIKLGIASYAIDIMPGALGLGQTVDTVKDFSNNKIIQDGRGTDAATGIKWAVNELDTKSSDDRQKAIILIGDGENSYIVNNSPVRTDAESQKILDDAIAIAQSKGIAVYTLAINPQSDAFRQYFKNISDSTGGQSYEPKDAGELDGIMDKIFESITHGTVVTNPPITLDAGKPVTKTFEVPDGVFEMSLQVDHQKPVEIYFTDPQNNVYNDSTKGVTVSKEKTYSTYKISEPISGKWSVTYKSETPQTITPKFIYHADVTVSLAKNQNDVMQKKDVEYIATVMAQGQEIADGKSLQGFNANLVISKLDDKNNVVDTETKKMSVNSGKFTVLHAIDDPGKYSIRVDLVGSKTTIKSNTLNIDVLKDPSLIPFWVYLLIIFGVLILAVVIVVFVMHSRSKPGGGYVFGNVAIKISGKLPTEETMTFQPNKFSCDQIFSKKNTLNDLIMAYGRWYKMINNDPLSIMTFDQYVNSRLSEVTEAITISGNKKKQVIVQIPAIHNMVVDGIDISKPKKLVFAPNEKQIDIRFNNQGNAYIINLMFTQN